MSTTVRVEPDESAATKQSTRAAVDNIISNSIQMNFFIFSTYTTNRSPLPKPGRQAWETKSAKAGSLLRSIPGS
jgi:hypothetical protein